MGEIVFHVLLIGAIGYFFKESLFIDTARASDPIGPAGFPQGILILAILLALFSFFQTIRKRKRVPGSSIGRLSFPRSLSGCWSASPPSCSPWISLAF